jgi:uncharacterized protein (TIGR03083 family)
VLSHLGSGAEIFLATLQAAVSGTGAPANDFNQTVWDRWNAMSPSEQAAGFLVANEKLVQAYEGLDETQRQELRVKFGFMPEPLDVATVLGMRLNEFTLHSWDVRVAFDSTAALAADAVGPLLDSINGTLAWAGKADKLDGGARIAVRTTDPDRAFGIVIAESAQLSDEVPAPADAELTAPAEYVVRFVTGRNSAQYTPASVQFTSEKLTLDDLRVVFPGY